MPLFQFSQQAGNPQKILDTGKRPARIRLQVLDASTLFFDDNRDTLLMKFGTGNVQQGFQLVQSDRIYKDWWKGELWAINTTAGALIAFSLHTIDEPKNYQAELGIAEGYPGGDGVGCSCEG